ncbi:hypothetical protein [Deinococcus roseus]|uniref:DUF4224 domain-containing protein n=1 Tax=Deinococcus roseus TaxID=392414 RepID=A0ABQ2D309_9DEIO|nr:hypothetical protein [Deinococcus roseus]GGJ42490.1 hypothetical protein GCM10008938_30770 [Deinococcus roseus]
MDTPISAPETGTLATLLTPKEIIRMQRKYPTLEECCTETGYEFASLRARTIRLNTRWKYERKADVPAVQDSWGY